MFFIQFPSGFYYLIVSFSIALSLGLPINAFSQNEFSKNEFFLPSLYHEHLYEWADRLISVPEARDQDEGIMEAKFDSIGKVVFRS